MDRSEKEATDKRREIKRDGKAGGEADGKGSRQHDTNKRNRERIKGHYFGPKEEERERERERERSAARVRKELDLLDASQARRTECNAIRR